MNIDITALLTGKLTALLPQAAHAHPSFALALHNKRITLEQEAAQVEPDPVFEVAVPPLPQIAPLVESIEREGEAEPALGTENLLPQPTAGMAETQWQLQQWVNGSARGGGTPLVPRSAEQATAQPIVPAAGEANRLPPAPLISPGVLPREGEARTPNGNPVLPAQETAIVAVAVETVTAPPANPVPVSLPLRAAMGPVALPTPTPTVSSPPDTPEWKQEVSQHIALLSRHGVHSAEIRLHPETLGTLHISLRIQNEQAQIHITSEHAQVRQAMEQALPQLRVAMAESGVQLSQASVGADSAQAGAGDRRGTPQPPQPTQEHNESGVAEDALAQESSTLTVNHHYGINTFA